MCELKNVISEINVLEARNRQYESRASMGLPPPEEYERNKKKLEGLYIERSRLSSGKTESMVEQ